MYICEFCKKQIATIHITDIHDNVKKEVHMCEACAESKGVSIKHSISLQNLVTGDVADIDKFKDEQFEDEAMCDFCGMSWSEFRAKGRFGCARDYTAFEEQLAELLQDIHGGNHHVGKELAKEAPDREVRREILECQRKLREAVEREHYEQAAELRDKLNHLNEKLKGEN